MRATEKHINKEALAHNLKIISDIAPNSQCIAVIKANAYGCEATKIISALSDADLFAMASIDEALTVRQVNTEKPILLLEGVFEMGDMEISHNNNCELVISTVEQLNWLLDFEQDFSRVWFKLDTGMGRLGFQPKEARATMNKLLSRYTQTKIVLMTHFSDADSVDRTITDGQIKYFDEFAIHYPDCEQCLCNSASIFAYPDAHRDYIRPGIALYGVSPFENKSGEDHGLRPVMTLKTRVISVKHFDKGQPIGYGQTFIMPKSGYIAVCAIGYADGYLRFLPNRTPILIAGREYQIAGRISMDMITVAVDDQVLVGDEVICWGNELPIEQVSKFAQTIPYQLLTAVTARPKVVVE